MSLQLFLVSLAFVFFAKAFSGAYMKSSITQIERRFDIPSSLTGVLDGSFEMGKGLPPVIINIMADSLHIQFTLILVKLINYHKKKMEQLTKAPAIVAAASPKQYPAF